MADATISPAGKAGLIKAAQGIALVALQLLEEPETFAEVQKEQNETLSKLLG